MYMCITYERMLCARVAMTLACVCARIEVNEKSEPCGAVQMVFIDFSQPVVISVWCLSFMTQHTLRSSTLSINY